MLNIPQANCTVLSQTRSSKQCAYRDRQVPRLGRISTSYHQHKPHRQVAGLDRLLEHIW